MERLCHAWVKDRRQQKPIGLHPAGIALLELVPLLAEKDNQFRCTGFPLYHPDLNLENIFVDDQLNISCIIDSGFASFIPQSMFFICPGLPQSRYGTDPNLELPFAQGFIEGHGFDAQKDLDFSNSSIFWKLMGGASSNSSSSAISQSPEYIPFVLVEVEVLRVSMPGLPEGGRLSLGVTGRRGFISS